MQSVKAKVGKYQPIPRIVAGCLFAGLSWSAAALADNGPEQPFYERIEVEVLNLEVAVTDRDGQRIHGLEASNFELFVDGEPTPIDYFMEIREGRVGPSEPSSPELSPGKAASTAFLVFIDEFFSIQRDKDRVLASLQEQVADMRPEDRMAVVAWNGAAIEILSDWQSSADALTEVLERVAERKSLGLERELERQRFGLGAATRSSRSHSLSSRLGTEERDYAALLAAQLQAAVGASSAALRSLPTAEGRQALILLSGGWPHDVASYVGRFRATGLEEPGIPNGTEIYSPLTRTANLLGFTIYAVDMPGLQTGSGARASRMGSVPFGSRSTEFEMEIDVHASLRLIAGETGGLAFLDGQRLEAFADLGKDLHSYYSLGFTPLLEGDDVRRDLEVRLSDPDLRVRTRTGYHDLSTHAQVELAVESSLLFGAPRRSPSLEMVVSELEKKRRGTVEAKLTFLIRADALTRETTAEGWTAQAVLFIGALDEKGGRTEVTPIQIMVSGKESPDPQSTYRYEKTVKLSWKTQRLSAALYDIAGSRTFVTVLER